MSDAVERNKWDWNARWVRFLLLVGGGTLIAGATALIMKYAG